MGTPRIMQALMALTHAWPPPVQAAAFAGFYALQSYERTPTAPQFDSEEARRRNEAILASSAKRKQ